MLSPRDMALQLPARQNQQTNLERVVSNGLEFILTFDQRACVLMVPHVTMFCEKLHNQMVVGSVMLMTCEIFVV